MKVWVWATESEGFTVSLDKPVLAECGKDCCGYESNIQIELCSGRKLFKGLRNNTAPKAYELTAKEVK